MRYTERSQYETILVLCQSIAVILFAFQDVMIAYYEVQMYRSMSVPEMCKDLHLLVAAAVEEVPCYYHAVCLPLLNKSGQSCLIILLCLYRYGDPVLPEMAPLTPVQISNHQGLFFRPPKRTFW